MKPYIVDVHLSVTDETYYPLVGRSKYNDVYSAHSPEGLMRLLDQDGWRRYGIVLASDGQASLDMFHKTPTATDRQLVNGDFISPNDHWIAIAEEN
jgi:hypothetical protein